MGWLMFSLMTVLCWGLYGICLHTGQIGMSDPISGRYKAFLFVGIAYFLIAVLAPLFVLWWQGAAWEFPLRGATWSILAGSVGAIGAFCVLLAFGSGGSPAVVMTLVFAGAPVVNALVVTAKNDLWGDIRWPFAVGILLAAIGAGLVTSYKPVPQHSPPDAVHHR